jgi:hypothetical protein
MKSFYNPSAEHLCLCGIIIKHTDNVTIKENIDSLKSRYFEIDTENNNYPLHRKEITKKTHPFDCLSDPAIESEFNAELLSNLYAWDYTIITVLIDKAALKNKYSNPRNPYRWGFGLMMERYAIFLKKHKGCGDIMVESINKKHDKKLEELYEFLYNNDFEYFKHTEFQNVLSSKQLKVKSKKACICGLEIADLLASTMRKYINTLYYPARNSGSVFDEQLINGIKCKILKKNGCETGIGIKKFP